MTTILILALAFFALIAALRLDLALFFIIALLPSYLIRFNLLGVPMTFLEAMILISFVLWFFKSVALNLHAWLQARNKRTPYPFGPEIIAILILSFIAVGVAGFSFSAMGVWKAYFFEPILLFILIMNVLQGESGRKKILWALVAGAAVTSLIAIFQQATGLFIANKFWADAETRRVVSWFGYPNAVGLFLAPLAALFSGWLIKINAEKEKNRVIASIIIGLTIAASLLSIFFAESEGALIGLAAAFFFVCFATGKKSRLAISIITIIGMIIILSVPSLKTYASDKVLLRDLSGEIRQRQWKETMMSLKGRAAFWGNGLSGYQMATAPFHQEGIFFNRDRLENFDAQLRASAEMRAKYWQPVEIYMYPHNIFLNFWSEIGLLGALAFTWLVLKYIFISLRLAIRKEKRDWLAMGLFAAMIAIAVHGLVDVPYFKNDLSAMFFVLLALLGSLIVENKIKKI